MSSRLPATITCSLEEFAQRGGRTGPHSDGWGIAYYVDWDARVIRDVDAAADSAEVPPIDARLETVVDFARTLRELGPANFVYFDGDALFLHGHRRKHDGEEEPRPPGLHTLCRSCTVGGTAFETDGLTISGHNQHVVLAATVPLTDEPWEALTEGEIVVARRGEIVARAGSEKEKAPVTHL